MEDTYKVMSQVEVHRGTILKRRIGEESFVGFKTLIHHTPEELFEWLRHLHAYKYVKSFVEDNSVVLDLGCGTGYGSYVLSMKAGYTIGIDIWKEGIRHCHQEYGKKNSFLAASGLNLPFKDNSFDLVALLSKK
jgi:SAM-dependent methyltransferase